MLDRTSSSPHKESDFPRFDRSNWTHMWTDSHRVRGRRRTTTTWFTGRRRRRRRQARREGEDGWSCGQRMQRCSHTSGRTCHSSHEREGHSDTLFGTHSLWCQSVMCVMIMVLPRPDIQAHIQAIPSIHGPSIRETRRRDDERKEADRRRGDTQHSVRRKDSSDSIYSFRNERSFPINGAHKSSRDTQTGGWGGAGNLKHVHRPSVLSVARLSG